MNLLERQRRAAGLTQIELAGRIGASRESVRRWESGDTQPHPQYVPRLAEIFGITPLEVTRLIVPEDAPAGQPKSADAEK